MMPNENIVKTIGRYQLVEEIGRGGMAVVYRAIDTSLKREVAVKLLHPHLASHGESRTRFYREAQAVARLKHESVLEIYDYSGDDGDDVYIVMELIEGTTLRRLLDEKKGEPLSSEAAALLIRPVLSALSHAHANGLIHRDVKPENILIGPDGEIKLSDFGIAHIAGLSEMTVTGQILGSPAYMSPEHVELIELDARADIFSVGIILYEAAVGRQPFEGKSPHAMLKRIVEGTYDDPLAVLPSVGLPLARIIRKCLKTNPDERYETAKLLIENIDALLLDAGIENPKQEQTSFLKAPDEWVSAHRQTVLDRTVALGIQAKKKNEHVEATAHFNRVLALDPGNEKALALAAGMNRSRRVRRAVERAATVLTLLGAITAVLWAVFRPAAPTPIPPRVDEPRISKDQTESEEEIPEDPTLEEDIEENSAQKTPAKQTPPNRHPGRASAQKNRHRSLTPHKAEADTVREVTFTPHPLSVKIIIDNDPPFPFGPANRTKKLPVGKHKITFIPNDKKRFLEQTWTVDIPAAKEPFAFRKRLMWRPARLLVKSERSASVTVPGRVTSTANRIFNVEMKKGPSEQLSVLVSQEGYVPQTKRVTITAGELSTVEVKLVKAASVP